MNHHPSKDFTQRIPNSGNSVHTRGPLQLVFRSLRSYGHSGEKMVNQKRDGSNRQPINRASHHVLPDNTFEQTCTDSDGSQLPTFHTLWSSPERPFVSRLADAAGSLYRTENFENHWILGKSIGCGAFSVVRLGQSKDETRTGAIKIIEKGAPALFTGKGECREVVALRISGKHSNVVTCLEVYEDEGFIYLVLELLTGGPMLRRVSDNRLYARYCEHDVRILVRDITRGLAHLHGLGIVHRDIKPENIMFISKDLSNPTVKLTDFGIAHPYCLSRNATDMVGTPLYVAPEVLLRKPYSCEADMWSLGIVAHILLTGFPPFDHDDLVQLVNMVKHKPLDMNIKAWRMISNTAKDFVTRLLHREVDKRMTASQALSHPWLLTCPPPPSTSQIASSNCEESTRTTGAMLPHQSNTIPLLFAQSNIHSFVTRNEWRKSISPTQPEYDPNLSVLVSLSEKSLKLSKPYGFQEHKTGMMGFNGLNMLQSVGSQNETLKGRWTPIDAVPTASENCFETFHTNDVVRINLKNKEKERQNLCTTVRKQASETAGLSSTCAIDGNDVFTWTQSSPCDKTEGNDILQNSRKASKGYRKREFLEYEEDELYGNDQVFPIEPPARRMKCILNKSSITDRHVSSDDDSTNDVGNKRWSKKDDSAGHTFINAVDKYSVGSCRSALRSESEELGVAELLQTDPSIWRISVDDDDWEDWSLLERERREADAQEDEEQVFIQRGVMRSSIKSSLRSSGAVSGQKINDPDDRGNWGSGGGSRRRNGNQVRRKGRGKLIKLRMHLAAA